MAGVLVYGYYVFSTALYVDDYYRIVTYAGWNGDGRMLQTWFYRLVSGFRSIHYLGHFGQLVAIALLSILALLLVNKYSPRVNGYSMFLALALLFFPYTHDIMKYRYDSMGMALALLLACLPLLMPYDSQNKKAKMHHFIIGFVLLLASFSTYQLAITAFVGLVMVEFMSDLATGVVLKKAFKTAFYWASMPAAAVVVYYLLRKIGVIESGNGWVDERATIVQGGLGQQAGLIINNIISYSKATYDTFKIGFGNSIGLFGAVIVAVVYVVQQLFTVVTTGKSHRILRILLVMGSLLFLFLCPGLLILFSNEFVMSDGRYLYGASAIFTSVLLAVGQTAGSGHFSRVTKILLVWFVLLLTSNTAAYFADLTLKRQIEQNKVMQTMVELQGLGKEYRSSSVMAADDTNLDLYMLYYSVVKHTSLPYLWPPEVGKSSVKVLLKEGSFADFYLRDDGIIEIAWKVKEDNK